MEKSFRTFLSMARLVLERKQESWRCFEKYTVLG